ncbi:hypothetical protein Aduo_018319 [Ancylostoma duodenale]
MVDNDNNKDFIDKYYAWSLKEDKKLCDSMESGKEKVISQVKQLEEKLGHSCQSIQQLSSYVDKVHATLAASSYSRFIEQEIADDFHQRATFSEGTFPTTAERKSSERTVLAFEVLRTAINLGIANIAQLKEDIKEVSSVPDLISPQPNMSARGPSSENLADSTSIARESCVEQETASDDTGKVKKSMHDGIETKDDTHAQPDLTPIPSAAGSGPKSLSSSGAVPSDLDRSSLVASSTPELSGLVPKNMSSSVSGTVPSDLDRSFLIASPTSGLSGSSSLFKGIDAGDDSRRRESEGQHITSSSSRTVPSELDRSFLLPSSASDISDLSHFLTKSHSEHSDKKEESEKKESTSVVATVKDLPSEPLCPKKITDKYKSIFDDEDDDDDLFDIKSKKTQKEVSAPTTKPPPKKLQESNFSKLLGEKLARGPAQPVKSQPPVTTSKSEDARVAVSNTAKDDKKEDKKPDSYEPLHSIAKQRTRGPARRPPSKRRTAMPDPVELPTEDIKNLTIQSETNLKPAAPSTDTAKLAKEDVTKITTHSEPKTVLKDETADDVGAATKKTSSRAEVVQRSAVQSFFDADSDEDDKEENQPPKKTEKSSNSEAADTKPRTATPKAPSSITAQSLFAEDDDDDLSLFRKK